jgi:hypothetical protein
LVPAQSVTESAYRAAAQGLGVLPPLAEDGLDVTNGRPHDHQLYVVPGRAIAVHLGHRLALRIAGMGRIVAAAVAQVDSTDERHVLVRSRRMPQHDELLVV